MGIEEVLELQRAVRRECQELCFDVPLADFDRTRAETVLHEFEIDELRWMADYYFSCLFPFPRGLWLDDQDKKHYSGVIRAVGGG